jgi:hypothetical protein
MAEQIATVALFKEGENAFARITFPQIATASPQDFVACVDVSGSMGTEQSIVTSGGIRESHGFSTLDIVKHALKVKVNTLEGTDRFALVAYHTEATIVVPLIEMTPEAKQIILTAIDRLTPQMSTNIFDGLQKSFQCFGDESISPLRIRSILLYTDGVNNAGPAEGPLAAFQDYIKRFGLPAQVSINGFGTETDPILMRNLADIGRGLYFFTPDAGMIGTTCVNYMANLKTTVATKVDLQVGTKTFLIGALLADQPTYVRLTTPTERQNVTLNIPFQFCTDSFWTEEELSREKMRFDLLAAIGQVLQTANYDLLAASKIFINLARTWAGQNERQTDLFTDLTGELLKSVANETEFRRWGRNYLLATETAHLNGKQTNFKDISLRAYTSAFRETIKTACNLVFDKLPPPARSAVSTISQPAPLSMRYYNNDADPCMAGHGLVKTASGTMRVDQLHKGTKLANGDIVLCVVQTVTSNKNIDLVDVGSTGTPWITPYHPIRINNVWQFPIDVSPSLFPISTCPAVYSFVLEGKNQVLTINGVECIALAHGFTEPVAAHPYLGTSAILDDLQILPGFTEGLVQMNSQCMLRTDGLISGFSINRVLNL